MSDKVPDSRGYETTVLNAPTAGVVRVNKLANIDYLLIGLSAVIFIAGSVLLAQSKTELSKRRFSKKMVLAVLLLVLGCVLRPFFDYLFANNPNAPLFS